MGEFKAYSEFESDSVQNIEHSGIGDEPTSWIDRFELFGGAVLKRPDRVIGEFFVTRIITMLLIEFGEDAPNHCRVLGEHRRAMHFKQDFGKLGVINFNVFE